MYFLSKGFSIYSSAANSPYLGFFCSRYPTWGSDGKLYSPWTDGRVKVGYLKGEKGAAGGSGGSWFPFSFDVTEIKHFIRLQSSSLCSDFEVSLEDFPVDQDLVQKNLFPTCLPPACTVLISKGLIGVQAPP